MNTKIRAAMLAGLTAIGVGALTPAPASASAGRDTAGALLAGAALYGFATNKPLLGIGAGVGAGLVLSGGHDRDRYDRWGRYDRYDRSDRYDRDWRSRDRDRNDRDWDRHDRNRHDDRRHR